MQLCAAAAERTRLKMTSEERSVPAGTGDGEIISTIRPKG